MGFWLLLKGFGLGASMIIPIGAQNAFVLNQGIKRNHHLSTATICSLCDVALIAVGIFGGGALFSSDPRLLLLITLAGSAFLVYYGLMSLKSAWRHHHASQAAQTSIYQPRLRVVLSALAVTLLNPHVYLDTIVVLGSIGSQYESNERLLFALGTMIASLVWFYGLAIGAAKLAPVLSRRKVKMGIDLAVAAMMLFIASQLLLSLRT